MRTLGYVVVGYLLVSLAGTGLAYSTVSPSGLIGAFAGLAGLVWLVRSYRRGKEDERIRTDVAATVQTVERRLADRAAELAALPLDPLDLPWLVDAAYALREDPDGLDRIGREYDGIRAEAARTADELERLRVDRRSAPTDARLLLHDYERLDAALDELEGRLAALGAGSAAPEPVAPPEPAVAADPAPQLAEQDDPLSAAAIRAREARDDVWALSLAASAPVSLRELADRVERAYQDALGRARSAGKDRDALAAAVAAFAEVEARASRAELDA